MKLAAVALPDPARVSPEGCWDVSAYDVAFAALHATGYRWFELSRTRRLTEETAAAIRERAAALGLTAVALHAPSLHGPAALERQRAVIRAAHALGALVIVFHVSSLRFAARDAGVRERARAWDRQRVRVLAEWAGEHKMHLALENASHPEHPSYLLALREAVGLPNVGLALDTGHANLRGTRAHEVASDVAAAVVHTHLHDNTGTRDDHLPPGQGTIDWPRLTAALHAVQYDGAWCVELKALPRFRLESTLRASATFLQGLDRDGVKR